LALTARDVVLGLHKNISEEERDSCT
jgi:hypothetical protein